MAVFASPAVLEEQAEVVPGIGIVGVLFHRLLQQRPGLIEFAQIQQGNPLIQPRNLKRWIDRGSVLECFQGFFKELLIHVGNAEIVEVRCSDGRGVSERLRRGCEKDGACYQGSGQDNCISSSHARNKLTTEGTEEHRGFSPGSP